MATSIVAPTNSHPFVFGRHAFMHNGTVSNFNNSPTLKRRILMSMSAKAAHNVHGSTDSEHLAGLYFTYLGEDWEQTYPLAEMKAALEKAIQTLIDFQKEEVNPNASPAPHERSEDEGPNALNLCTSDGSQLLAFRFRDSALDLEQPPSLYYSTTAGPTLNRKYEGHPDRVSKNSSIRPEELYEVNPSHHFTSVNARKTKRMEGNLLKDNHDKHVIVTSEPTTFDQREWELIPKNTAVLVGVDMSVELEPINVGF
jgi:glutamine amidotransferase